MMKKVLILMLVLGMTSAASATLSLGGASTVDIGSTAVVTVSSDNTLAWMGYLESLDGGVTSVVETIAAGVNASVVVSPWDYVGYWALVAEGATPVDPLTPGVHFNATVTSNGSDYGMTYVVSLYAADWQTILDTQSVTVIPEPMTIVLLGLGGLFLRRRK